GAFAVMPFKFNAAELDDDGKPTRFEMIPDPRVANWPEGVYERVCKPEAWLEAWKVSGWNTAKIRCVGKYPQITTWINGLEACHFNGETCTLPGYDKERVFELLGREGSIALQVHGGKAWSKGAKVRWRNLRIKHL
ncbi:MAG: family 16 glycoside hydrolase, partial [Verrucomicrobiota bacterium]